MRVLNVITGLGTGGAEAMLLKVIQHTQGNDVSHAVVSMIEPGATAAAILAQGVTVHGLGMQRARPSVAAVRRLRAIAREQRPDVVLAWMYHAMLLSIALRLPGAVPLVWNVRHSVTDIALEPRLTRLVIRACAGVSRMPAAIIFNSARSAAQHAALGYRTESSHVIPNGFDCARFAPDATARARQRQIWNVPDAAPLIGHVARYHPMKNHALFVAVAGRLALRFPDARFVMAGLGVDAKNATLLAQLAAAGITDRTELLGNVERIESVLPALDVVCLTSSWGEAFPNILGEAQLCGVPCVSTDVGDAADIVQGAGASVAPDDVEEFTRAVERLLRLPASERRALGATARAQTLQRYSIDLVAQRYVSLLRAAAATGPAGRGA